MQDTHVTCGSAILSLSLGSGAVMLFRGPAGQQVTLALVTSCRICTVKLVQVPVWLPARSLLVMTGQSSTVQPTES